MNASAKPRATFLRVYLALLGLLALTAVAGRFPASAWSLPFALLVATAKLALIFWFFMRLREHRGLVRIFAVAGFFWLGLLGLLASSDYLTRGWLF
jgi:cytochrome c oxidase subunit 4